MKQLFNPSNLKRFIYYTLSGGSTFILDFGLLWIFVKYLHLHYIVAAIVAFIIGTFIHYNIIRHTAFRDSGKDYHVAYIYFISISAVGLLITVALLALFIEYFGVHLLVARVFAAACVGVWNFTMNFFINFKSHQLKQGVTNLGENLENL